MDHNDKKVKRKVQMLKVIQTLKLELHRGREVNTSDPYSYRSKIPRRIVGGLKKTLDTGMSSLWPRCSSTYIKNQKTARLLGASASILLLTLFALTILPVSSKPSTAEAAGTSSSTTITTSAATASVDLTTISSDGTFASSSSSEQASFGVTTTNYTGYTLTITAADDAGTLTNTTSTGSFSSISGVVDEKTFDDSSYNGKWGWKPSKYNSVDNVAYWPSPTTIATTLDVTDAPNSIANTYTIALGARAAYTQPTGTYAKTVILTATANPSAYSITYTDNTGDASVTNIPDATSSTTDATSINLSSVTPSRTGYIFNGWCSEAPTASGTVCSGTTYSVGGSYDIDQTTTNITTLYATWTIPDYSITIKPSTGIASVSLNGTSCSNTSGCVVSNLTYGQTYSLTATIASGYTFSSWYTDGLGNVGTTGTATIVDITNATTSFKVGEGVATITAIARYTMPAGTTMQNFTAAMCDAMPEEQVYTLTDTRDNTMYTVAKLKDGKCWMTQNLKLGAKTSTMSLTTADSNVSSSGFTLSNRLTDGHFPYTNTSGTYIYDSQAYYCTDAYGCYYNNYTATAGSMTYSISAGVNVNYSICPAGWNLPTGGPGGQFEALTNAYGGTGSAAAAAMLVANPTTTKENVNGQYSPGFLVGGYYSGGGGSSIGADGTYWSRTAYAKGKPYYMVSSVSHFSPLSSNHSYYGFAVRCLLNS